MAIQYDMHMHSSFSTDSDAPMEDMVRRAMELNLVGICFTEHMDLEYPEGNFPAYPEPFVADSGAVLAEIQRLRESFPSFWIGFGLEFGMQAHLAGEFHSIAADWPLDFIVASQHLVDSLDPYYPDSWEGTDPSVLIGHYYEEMLSNLKTMEEWDTLAHMDYIIRYIPEEKAVKGCVYDSMEHHADLIDEILRHVIYAKKCLEVNTSGYKYGLGQPNPTPSILRRYRELGGERITIGADAHAPEHIAFAFDRVRSLLRSMGYRSYCVFEGRHMREIPL